MKYTIVISDEAKNDLRQIYNYIAVDLSAPVNAKGQLSRLEENILALSEMPKRFPLYQNEPWNSLGMRYLAVNNYVVFYIPFEDIKTVKIMRILYSGRNVDSVLKNMY
jgi:toxin ParE1/3/4